MAVDESLIGPIEQLGFLLKSENPRWNAHWVLVKTMILRDLNHFKKAVFFDQLWPIFDMLNRPSHGYRWIVSDPRPRYITLKSNNELRINLYKLSKISRFWSKRDVQNYTIWCVSELISESGMVFLGLVNAIWAIIT